MNRFLILVALSVGFNISAAKADTCGEFVARVIEGAAYYKVPEPKFEPIHDAGADGRYWNVSIFEDVRAMFVCDHGDVGTFAAGSRDPGPSASD
jgi:hypothetical protein